MHLPRTLLAILASSSLAAAQTTTSVTITESNMVYRQAALPASTSNSWSLADLRATGAAGLDNLFSLWWWYRVSGDSQEFSFRNDPAPNAPTRVATGPTIVTSWPNVGGRNLFSALLTNVLVSTGIDSGYVATTLDITNTGGAPLTIDIFALSDLDVGGSASGYLTNVSWGDIRSQYTEQDGTTLPALEFYCPNADAVQVDPYLTTTPGRLPYLLTNTTVDNLAGWNGTFGPGDHNGAFQWQRTIAPAATASFAVFIAMTPNRPLQLLYGTAGPGTPGLPTIGTSERALVDPTAAVARSFAVQLGNALPLALGALLTNFNQAALQIQGLQIWVDPAGAVSTFVVTDPNGRAGVTMALPPLGALSGLQLRHQYLVLDSGGGALAAWTTGLLQQLGSW